MGVCILVVVRCSDYLLVDISDSDHETCVCVEERISAPVRIPTAELSRNVVAEFLRRRQIGKLVVSSVVPTKNSAILKAAHNKTPVLWLDWKLKLDLTIRYPKPDPSEPIAWRTRRLLPSCRMSGHCCGFWNGSDFRCPFRGVDISVA